MKLRILMEDSMGEFLAIAHSNSLYFHIYPLELKVYCQKYAHLYSVLHARGFNK